MLATLLLSMLACGSEPPAEPPKPVEAPKPAGPTFDYSADAANLNVIVISLDALRFDRTGLGGSKLTPNLDEFQKDAVAFTKASSAAPWTVPSHMAIITGRWPTHHGVVNKLKPGPDGKWNEGRTDEDIYFWRNWRDSGNKIYVSPRICIGHGEYMITWPGKDLQKPVYQYTTTFNETGKRPDSAWSLPT